MKKVLICAALAGAALVIILVGKSSAQAGALEANPGAPVPEAACRACHDQKNLSLNLPSGETIAVYVSPSTLKASVHGSLQCTACHQSATNFPHQTTAANLRQFRVQQDQACRTCHRGQASEVQASIHGQSEAGDSGLCIDCHGAHDVQDPLSASYRISSVSVCTRCHQNSGLMNKYGVSTQVVSTYFQDFHGKTEFLVKKQPGDPHLAQAVCTDCHGTHNIQKVDSPTSRVVKDNLASTCARCHPGASANFPAAWLSHKEPSLTESPLVFGVRWFYRIMIPFIVVGLLAHVLIDALQVLRRKGAEYEIG